MTTLMPHLELDQDLVDWGPWRVGLGSGPEAEVTEHLVGWDYSVPLTFRRGMTLDVDRALEKIGIPDLNRLGLYLKVDCPESDLQIPTVVPLSDLDDDNSLEATVAVDAGSLAETVFLESGFVLLSEGPTTNARAARRPGSILLRTRQPLRLEGKGGRMSIDVVEFPSPSDWERSPWRIHIDYEDASVDSFAGSTVVQVNDRHPAAEAALDPGHPRFKALSNLLMTDVVRAHLFRFAFDGTPPPSQPDEDSVANQLEIYSRAIFQSSLIDLLARLKSDPEDVEVVLKSHFKYLEGLT
ncbi:hypothetical protein ACPCG0_03710 [Propionibacteriaceae bacterium Y1923]